MHGSFHNRTGLNNSVLILDIRKSRFKILSCLVDMVYPIFDFNKKSQGFIRSMLLITVSVRLDSALELASIHF